MNREKSTNYGKELISLLAVSMAYGLTDANANYPVQVGWPQEVQGVVEGSLIAADIDIDGTLEVIGVSRIEYDKSRIYIWDAQGNLRNGWPQELRRINGMVTVGDLDADHDLEIVVSTLHEAAVYVFEHDGTQVARWPTGGPGPQIANSAATLGDFDGDNGLEVFIMNSWGSLFAWHHDGTPLFNPTSVGGFTYSPVSLGDLDNCDPNIPHFDNCDPDKDLEMITSARWGDFGWITAYHHEDKDGDGNPDHFRNWYVADGHGQTGDVVLADIDADTTTEVLTTTSKGYVYAWELDGTVMEGWPRQGQGQGMYRLAVGDLDNDGDLEVVAAYPDVSIHVWHHDGTVFGPWPVPGRVIGNFPVIADVDADNRADILTTHSSGVYAYRSDGSPVPGWPLAAPQALDNAAALVVDLDADNDLEVLVGAQNQVHAWDAGAEYDAAFVCWNGYQHDRHRSGNYSHRIKLRVTSDGYSQLQAAFDAAQAGDIVEADPTIFSEPVSAIPKSGIDLYWKY